MDILKILLITAMISGCAHTFSEGESEAELEEIPEFKSLVGNGVLHQHGPSIEDKKTEAIFSFNENFNVAGRESCEAVILTSMNETFLTVAKCRGEFGYEICGRAEKKCIVEFDTKKTGNTLYLINDGEYVDDDVRHTVEFFTDKIVYKIQEESCLIPYPHGCIINGFNWVDQYTYIYTFSKN